MAPSSGHLLVPKILRAVKFGIERIKSKLPQSTQSSSATNHYSLQPIRIHVQNQPIHPIAYLKQSRSSNQNRWFSSKRSPTSVKHDRSKFPTSRISKAISQRGVTPFASTLRPNLTGGALPRSAGGYGFSGTGTRHFSHTSGAQAQVVQNVSAGMRAFLVGGGKARFDGVDPVSGEKRFRSVSHTEDAVYTQWESPLAKSKRGTNLDFKIIPTVTALSPIFSSADLQPQFNTVSLNDAGLLDTLATDFAEALKDLAAVLADLRVLSSFGDLPISLITTSSGALLRVRFPGCDGDLVSRLCDEVGVRRGLIIEDEAWNIEKDVEMALLFPFAPMDGSDVETESDDGRAYFEPKARSQSHQADDLEWRHMLSPALHTPPRTESLHTRSTIYTPPQKINTPSGYESLRDSDFASEDPYYHFSSPSVKASTTTPSADFEGLEGIYKFLQECEESRR